MDRKNRCVPKFRGGDKNEELLLSEEKESPGYLT